MLGYYPNFRSEEFCPHSLKDSIRSVLVYDSVPERNHEFVFSDEGCRHFLLHSIPNPEQIEETQQIRSKKKNSLSIKESEELESTCQIE